MNLIELWLPVVIKYGVPAAEQLYKMFTKDTGPTQADWDTLKSLTSTTGKDEMLKVLLSHNIDPASESGQKFLSLVK